MARPQLAVSKVIIWRVPTGGSGTVEHEVAASSNEATQLARRQSRVLSDLAKLRSLAVVSPSRSELVSYGLSNAL